MFDPEFFGGFFGFMEMELCRCPYCGAEFTRSELKRLMGKEKESFICPSCEEEVNIGDLKTGLE